MAKSQAKCLDCSFKKLGQRLNVEIKAAKHRQLTNHRVVIRHPNEVINVG